MNRIFPFLKKTRELDDKIGEFLVCLSQSGALFVQGIEAFLSGAENFKALAVQVGALEKHNDQLRRDVEEQMYVHTLLPDSRADVLTLLEGLDKLLNHYESILYAFDIEHPEVPEQLKDPLVELTKTVIESAEALVGASRSFFAMDGKCPSFIAEVLRLEKQADHQGAELQRNIFKVPDLALAHRRQLKDFEQMIERLSDMTEDVADKLTILSVKRAF